MRVQHARLSPVVVTERLPVLADGGVDVAAGLVEFPEPDIVLDALFTSIRRVASRITIVHGTIVMAERSTDDHLQGLAMTSGANHLMLLVWARNGQLDALLSRLERRVANAVWPPHSARLEWIGGSVWLPGGPEAPFDLA